MLLLFLGLLIFVLVSHHSLRKTVRRLDDLEVTYRRQVASLTARVFCLEGVPATVSGAGETPRALASDTVVQKSVVEPSPRQTDGEYMDVGPVPPTGDPETGWVRASSSQPKPRKVERPIPPQVAPSPVDENWRRVESRFAENWTGILGAVVLVAGITFIGAYNGLLLSPFNRTLMIVAAAGILAGGATGLRQHEVWRPLAAWLKSVAAAVFLFACYASSAIPGLQWIDSFGPALVVVLLGVGVNFYVAYGTSEQAFASLHVFLSMVPLMLLPQSTTALLIATAVTLAGLGLKVRLRWDVHVLITLAAFGVFHVAWYVRVDDPQGVVERTLGALAALLVASAVGWIHYRRTWTSSRIAVIPFLVHVGNWTLLAIAIGVYSGSSDLRGLSLLGASAVVFLLSRFGRRQGLGWVYLTDALVAEALAVAGLIAFYPIAFHWLLVPPVLLLEAGLFLKVFVDEDEPFLTSVAVHLVHAAVLGVGLSGLVALVRDPSLASQHGLLLLVAAFITAGIHLYGARARGDGFDSLRSYGIVGLGILEQLSVIGLGAGAIMLVSLASFTGGSWMEAAALASTAGFLLLARRFGSQSLGVAAWSTLLPAYLFSWIRLLVDQPVSADSQILYHLSPLAAAGFLAIGISLVEPFGRLIRTSCVYLLGIHVAVAAFTLLDPVSALLPGVMWLLLSLVALEIADRVSGDAVRPLLHVAYGMGVAFAGAYLLVIMMSQAYVGPLSARMLVEAFALAVLLYWAVYKTGTELESQAGWRWVHPLFLELSLLFVSVVTVVESSVQLRPVVWVTLALVTIHRSICERLDNRFRFYSLVLYWASAVDLVIVTSGYQMPSAIWYEHPGFTGSLALILQVVYLIIGTPRLDLAHLEVPPTLARLARWGNKIEERRALWIYYPFFVAAALFLYWRFDTTLLTLLWAGLAFVVFAVSLIIREGHFRYMALSGFGACLIRLLVIDMSQANLGLRGAVFVGVGLLMLGMNSLYTKYKGRLS